MVPSCLCGRLGAVRIVFHAQGASGPQFRVVGPGGPNPSLGEQFTRIVPLQAQIRAWPDFPGCSEQPMGWTWSLKDRFYAQGASGLILSIFDSFWLNSRPGLKNDFSAPKKANPGQGEVVTRLVR